MGRQANDGRGRLGGRTVGTKNKPQPAVTEWVDGLLNKQRRAVETSLTVGDKPTLAALLIVSALDRLTAAIQAAAGIDPETLGV